MVYYIPRPAGTPTLQASDPPRDVDGHDPGHTQPTDHDQDFSEAFFQCGIIPVVCFIVVSI